MFIGLLIAIVVFLFVLYYIFKLTITIGIIAVLIATAGAIGMFYVSVAVAFATTMGVYHITGLEAPALSFAIGVMTGIGVFAILMYGLIREIKRNTIKFKSWLTK